MSVSGATMPADGQIAGGELAAEDEGAANGGVEAERPNGDNDRASEAEDRARDAEPKAAAEPSASSEIEAPPAEPAAAPSSAEIDAPVESPVERGAVVDPSASVVGAECAADAERGSSDEPPPEDAPRAEAVSGFEARERREDVVEPDQLTFADLGLREEILEAVAETGYTRPTPIQAQAIPAVIAGGDVIGVAQTGTGKTASFTLPMLHALASGRARARMPRSLILSPTRELATQTADNFEVYGKHLKLSMALLIGGTGMGEQEKTLEKGVDVLIATPGRLLDWFERGKLLLGAVSILVVDEADRMLDMGFIPDVERIISLLLRRKQTLLFSATMPDEVRKLADRFMKDPKRIEVSRPATTSTDVVDTLSIVEAGSKLLALRSLLEQEDIEKAIVFCNRKRDVSALARHLKRHGKNASDIHGDLDQSQRQATLDAFKAGEIDLLVATDVAARGLDVSALPAVVNYDVPNHAEDYVHRIGRTGRAGMKGRAYTIALPHDAKFVDAIRALTNREIERLPIEAAPAAELEELEGKRKRRGRPPVIDEFEADRRRGDDARKRRRAAQDEDREADDATASATRRSRRPAKDDRPTKDERLARDDARPARGRSRQRSEREEEAPVVGFGDLAPAFILIDPWASRPKSVSARNVLAEEA